MLLPLVMLLAAQTPAERIRVDWLAPEGCPDRASLASRLEDSVAAGRTFTATVRIDEPSDPGKLWRAVVLTNVGDGQRSRLVEAPDCELVTEAAVLVITLAATSLAEDEPEGGPVTPATLPPAAARPGASSDQPDSARLTVGTLGLEAPHAWRVQLMPVVGANVGVLPSPGVAIGFGVVLGVGRWRGELALFQWLDSETPGTTRGARFSLVSAKLKGCWLFEPSSWLRLGPCIGAEGGGIFAAGRHISFPAETSTAWVAGLVGATLGVEASKRVRPWVSVEAGANFVRPEFVISTPTGDASVHRVSPLVGRATLGLEFSIP